MNDYVDKVDVSKLIQDSSSLVSLIAKAAVMILEPYISEVLTDPIIISKVLSNYYRRQLGNEEVYSATSILINIRNKCVHGKVNLDNKNKIKVFIRRMINNLNIFNDDLISRGIRIKEIEDIINEYSIVANYPVVPKQTNAIDARRNIRSPVMLLLPDGEITDMYGKTTNFIFYEATSPFNPDNVDKFTVITDKVCNLLEKPYRNNPVKIMSGIRSGMKGFILSSNGSNVLFLAENSVLTIHLSKTSTIELYIPK